MILEYFAPKGRIGEKWRTARLALPLETLFAAIGGVLCSTAFPPLNWYPMLLPAMAMTAMLFFRQRPGRAFFLTYVWSAVWTAISFFWLREIHPAIPFLLAPVMAVFAGVWGMTAAFLSNHVFFPREVSAKGFQAEEEYRASFWREAAFAALTAAGYVAVYEYARSYMLPWNFLSAALWKRSELLLLASTTGGAGVSFVLAWGGIALGMAVIRRTWKPFALSLAAGAAMLGAGALLHPDFPADAPEFTAGLVQGDISQRRNADAKRAEEALDVYLALTRELVKRKPDVIFWPETAVPYPFFSTSPVSARYRTELGRIIRDNSQRMVIGTLDFVLSPSREKVIGFTNSALFFDTSGGQAGRFDKVHRVPYGEYIPFRSWLPDFLVRCIDMNRDLTPGESFVPLEVVPFEVRAGMMICFEDVFPYVPREEVRRGANVLATITNDAWYPASSEPEQHLANSVMRAIECNLYFVRTGNNGGSCVITPRGRIEQVLEVPGEGPLEIRRGRGIAKVKFRAPEWAELTLFNRWGDWFSWLCLASYLLFLLYGAREFFARRARLSGKKDAPVGNGGGKNTKNDSSE